MRGAMTRVRAYSSKLLAWNMPRWRRSKASTFWSMVTPDSASLMTLLRHAGGGGLARHRGDEGIEVAAAFGGGGRGGEGENRAKAGRIRAIRIVIMGAHHHTRLFRASGNFPLTCRPGRV